MSCKMENIFLEAGDLRPYHIRVSVLQTMVRELINIREYLISNIAVGNFFFFFFLAYSTCLTTLEVALF